MERVQMLIDDINNDLEARKRGQETNPFEKQGKIAEMYPSVAINHPEDFYLNEAYYPENTRDKLDSSNKKTVIISIGTIKLFTFTIPFVLVINTKKQNIASAIPPNILGIPYVWLKYVPNPAIIMKNETSINEFTTTLITFPIFLLLLLWFFLFPR